MKITRKNLKTIIESYLKEDESKEEDNWLGKEELPDPEINEEDIVKKMNIAANNALKAYKDKAMKELLRQARKDNKYVGLSAAANAIYRTRHIFVKKIPGVAKDSHERIGALGTIAIFRKHHQYIDTLEPVGSLSKKNLEHALNILNKIDENDMTTAYRELVPLAVLNYSLLKTEKPDLEGRIEAVESTVIHEFDHVKSYILNSVLRKGEPRINVSVLRSIIRTDFQNMSQKEIEKKVKEETTTEDGKFLIQPNYLETIINEMLPSYKDVFDDSYDFVPGQADELTVRLHKLKNTPELISLIDKYHKKDPQYLPLSVRSDNKRMSEIKQILPFIKKDLSGKELKALLDDLAMSNKKEKETIPV